MILVILELRLVHPYQNSFNTLLEFCNIWQGRIRRGSTNSSKAEISMPSHLFKQIFGTNPRERQYKVPKNTEKFIEYVKVKKVIAN